LLKILPIGGVNEIGMNQFLFSYENTKILIDAGLGFPREANLGIDAVVPDYKQIFNLFPDISKLFISHAHEDHIGSIPYLLEQKNISIIAPQYAAKLIEHKCNNFFNNKKINIQIAEEGIEYVEGPFTIQYIWTNHSIPDTAAIFIKTPTNNILFSSDFKLVGKIDYIKNINRVIKKQGPIDIVLGDSTNALEAGYSIDDLKVEEGLDEIFKKSKGKIIVTLFSSHIDRINMFIRLCKNNDKTLFFSGLNLHLHTELAKSLNYLEDLKGILLDIEDLKKTPKNKVVLICTGSQGEENSSIFKLSKDRHPFTNIEKGDSIIFSSSTIPGNEKDILSTVNNFIEKEAIVYTDDRSLVHASGHACSSEIIDFIKNIKPNIFIPIHGEAIHLKANIDLAVSCGVKNCINLKKDNFLVIDDNKFNYIEIPKINKLFLDKTSKVLIEKDIIKERKRISSTGLIIVNLIIKSKTLLKVDIESIAVVKTKDLDKIYKNIELKVIKSYSKNLNKENLIERIKNYTKQEFRYYFKDKPEVFVNLIKL